jgi:uncharacterized membrane protein
MFLLTYGYVLKQKLRFRYHGILMSTALILHLIMSVYVMVPSFVWAVIPEYIISKPLSLTSVVGLIHGILGLVALLLGVWIVASWRFRKNIQGCIRRKKTMLKTIVIWIASLVLGIILYVIFIGSLLKG